MRDVIPVDWLRMFSERELQWLISGSDAPIDVMDLRAHCVYTGGYSSLSGGVRRFWNVVNKFTFIERRQLLRFVTSCERAPPLGFKALHPSFQIMWVTGAPNKRTFCFVKTILFLCDSCVVFYHPTIHDMYPTCVWTSQSLHSLFFPTFFFFFRLFFFFLFLVPSASTCFNTLKLPSYGSEKICREKLLMSIQSGAGFDLS